MIRNYLALIKMLKLDTMIVILSLLSLTLLFVVISRTSNSPSIHSTYLYLLIIILADIIYLIIKYFNLSPSLKDLADFRTNNGSMINKYIINSLYLTFITCSIISIWNRPFNYSRPSLFFLFISLSAVVVILEILITNDKNNKSTFFILIKIFIIGLILRWSVLCIFPGEIWYDPWFHRWFTEKLVLSGSIPQLDHRLFRPYDELPIMHLLIGFVMILTNSDWRSAASMCISYFGVILIVLSTYLICKYTCNNNNLGLLAASLVISADTILHDSLIIYPNFWGMVLALFLVYLMLAKHHNGANINFIETILSWLIMFVLILTHPAASITFVLIIFCLWASPNFINFFYQNNKVKSATKPITFLIFLLFFISMMAYWMYITGTYIDELGKLFRFGFQREYFGGMASEDEINYLMKTESGQYLLNRIGSFFLNVFGFIGLLYFSARKYISNLALTIAAFGLLGFGGVGLMIGMRNFETRFFLASQFIISIAVICGILYVTSIFKSSKIKVLVFTGIFFSIFFLSITSSLANFDNPIYTERVTRSVFIDSEIQSINTIYNAYSGSIVTDAHVYAYLNYKHNYNNSYLKDSINLSNNIVNKQFYVSGKLILVRRYFIENSLLSNYDIANLLGNDSKLYDSGSITDFMNLNDNMVIKNESKI